MTSSPASKLVRTFALLLTLTTLVACGTTPGLVAEPPARYDHALSVEVHEGDRPEEVERRTGGEIVVWRPEAGFAVVGLSSQGSDLRLLSDDAETNDNAISAPIVSAHGVWNSGFKSWSGGFKAWSGGFKSWSGGFKSWSGGFKAWSGGELTQTPMDNLDAWLQIGLADAHLGLAPSLGAGVTVAVIDTGVDLDHPAFAGRLVAGWDFLDGDAMADDEPGGLAYGHGTGIAGLILQVAPDASIMPLRVLSPAGYGDTDDVAEAIDWAVQHGADVINLSLGAGQESKILKTLLEYAAEQGVYVVASAGNEGVKGVTYPAVHTSGGSLEKRSLGVGSVDAHDVKSGFSNFGDGLTMLAPGESLFTVAPDERLAYWTGTSFAAPLATGTLALALAEPIGAEATAELADYVRLGADAVRELPGNGPFKSEISDRLDIASFLRTLELPDHQVPFSVETGKEWDFRDFDLAIGQYIIKKPNEVNVNFQIRSPYLPNLQHLRADSFVLRGETGLGAVVTAKAIAFDSDLNATVVTFKVLPDVLAGMLVNPAPGSTHTVTLEFALGSAETASYPVTILVR